MSGNSECRTGRRRVRRSVVLPGVAAVLCAAALLAPAAQVASAASSRNLRYAYDLESITSLDPAKSGNTCDGNIWQFVYGNLINVDNTGKLSPGLVQDWKLDGKTLTLTLRPGLTFQDGEKFDAAALKSGLDWNNQNKNLTSLDLIQSIDIVDDTTVRLNLRDNTGQQLVYALSGQDGFMVAPNAQKNAAKKPVGAGPFTFTSYAHGSKLSLKRFAGYYDNANWKLPGVDFVQVGFGPEVVTKLKSGDVDVIRFLSESYKVLKSDKSTGISVTPSTAVRAVRVPDRRSRSTTSTPARRSSTRSTATGSTRSSRRARVRSRTSSSRRTRPYHDPSLDGVYTYDPAKAKQAAEGRGAAERVLVRPGHPGWQHRQHGAAGRADPERPEAGRDHGDDQADPADPDRDAVLHPEDRQRLLGRGAGPALPLPNQFYENFGKGQFVAIFDNERAPGHHGSVEAGLPGPGPGAT